MELWAVGVPTGRRIKSWSETLAKQGMALRVFSFEHFISDDCFSEDVERSDSPITIRIESPGEDFETERFLLHQGVLALKAAGHNDVDSAWIDELCEDKGRIRHAVVWFEGWKKTLNQIEEKASALMQVKFMNSPKAIELMFNKPACQQYLSSCGIPVPKQFGPIHHAQHLQQIIKKQGLNKLYIKPSYGSSASGVMAYQCNRLGREALTTSIEMVQTAQQTKLYNNLKVKTYKHQKDIKAIVDEVSKQALYGEAWVPKHCMSGKVCDFRVLVIGGKACHFVMRLSKHTLTNTHLGNTKANEAEAIKALGADVVGQIKTVAEQAAQSINDGVGDCFYCGVDLALSTTKQVFVLEVNAFGDLLLNNNHKGLGTYETEYDRWYDLNLKF